MILRFCCFFFLLFSSYSLFAAASKPGVKLKQDSSEVTVRYFDAKALAEYKADSDFQYGRVVDNAMPSWWLDFWRWVWSLFEDVKLDPSQGIKWYHIGKWILITLCAAVIVFTIFKILGMDLRNIFSRKPKALDLPYSEMLENIHEISFDDELEKAIAAKNYRLAVRLLYLKCLKGLNDAGRIKWEIDKTNLQYINEMRNTEQKQLFRVLTTQFEFVWYGGFDVNEKSFSKINESFRNFNVKQR